MNEQNREEEETRKEQTERRRRIGGAKNRTERVGVKNRKREERS